MRRFLTGIALTVALLTYPSITKAQFLGTGPRDDFRDTTILRPPAGSKVAIIVFEDLGCPACAHAHPYENEAVEQTHVTLLRYDFPLEAHIWTFEGAVCARYILKTMGHPLAEEFRNDVFKSQRMIASKDDLREFVAAWLKRRGKPMPPVIDPDGSLAKEVSADYELGRRLNVEFTPTIVVVTRNQYQVVAGTREGSNDASELLPVVKAAIAQTK